MPWNFKEMDALIPMNTDFIANTVKKAQEVTREFHFFGDYTIMLRIHNYSVLTSVGVYIHFNSID